MVPVPVSLLRNVRHRDEKRESPGLCAAYRRSLEVGGTAHYNVRSHTIGKPVVRQRFSGKTPRRRSGSVVDARQYDAPRRCPCPLPHTEIQTTARRHRTSYACSSTI